MLGAQSLGKMQGKGSGGWEEEVGGVGWGDGQKGMTEENGRTWSLGAGGRGEGPGRSLACISRSVKNNWL